MDESLSPKGMEDAERGAEEHTRRTHQYWKAEPNAAAVGEFDNAHPEGSIARVEPADSALRSDPASLLVLCVDRRAQLNGDKCQFQGTTVDGVPGTLKAGRSLVVTITQRPGGGQVWTEYRDA